MKHDESSAAKIYWSKEYGKFSFIKGNRDISQTKVTKMMKAYHKGIDIFKYVPVLAYESDNNKLYIIDGQHRYMASKSLRLPIYYTVVRDFNLREIAEINGCMSNWKNNDYLNCYIDCGVADYKILAEFIKKHSVSVSTAVSLLSAGTIGGGGKLPMFRDGKFECRYLKESELLMTRYNEIKKFAVDPDRELLRAMKTLLSSQSYDHQGVINKISHYDLKIDRKANYKQYIYHIEELFNHKNSKRKTIWES